MTTRASKRPAKRCFPVCPGSGCQFHLQHNAQGCIHLPEGFAVFGLPEPHRVRMRTTNAWERLNKELKRRTRVATLFPNPNSGQRLASDWSAHYGPNKTRSG